MLHNSLHESLYTTDNMAPEVTSVEQRPASPREWHSDLVDSDQYITEVFNRLLELDVGQLRDFVEARAHGPANDLMLMLLQTRLGGERLTDWHARQGHFKGEQTELAYRTGIMYAVQLHEHLYDVLRAGRLTPTGEDATDAYDVASSVLLHSYDQTAVAGLSAWTREINREHYYCAGQDNFCQLSSLSSERLNAQMHDEHADQAFYTGLLDATIFLGAYIRWKDDGLPPERRNFYHDEYITYASNDVSAAEVTRLLADYLPSPEQFVLHTPDKYIRSVDAELPHPYHEWLLIDAAPDRGADADGNPTWGYHLLVRTYPYQVSPHVYEWHRSIVLVAPVGSEPGYGLNAAEKIIHDMEILPETDTSARNCAIQAVQSAMAFAEAGGQLPDQMALCLGIVGRYFRRRQVWEVSRQDAKAA